MKIVSLQAENVKRLRAVEIRPTGNLVEITGKNGQGKTSILDAIWWALGGAKHVQKRPIRTGQRSARVVVDLGQWKVTRTFDLVQREGETAEEVTTKLIVESAEGARFPQPQAMLDGLVGSLSFDPLAFTEMDAKGQFNALRTFVPDVDFDKIATANKKDFDLRRDVNRQAREARAAADQIGDIPDDVRPVDEGALIAALDDAGKKNAELEQRKARRDQAAQRIATLRLAVADARKQAAALLAQADADENSCNELEKKLADAGPLPEPLDTTTIREAIEAARQKNALVAKAQERARLIDRAQTLEAEARALTDAMEKREADKRASIARAKMPVPGLEFGDGEILLGGVPFDQASDAEQLRASVAIAAAMNPKLRIIRVRDGSKLDSDAMALLAKMAGENDCQVWVETVDSRGPSAIVIEDGMVKTEADQ
jgi:energy-coupling factor transporter ATP-binding protein EcfA2